MIAVDTATAWRHAMVDITVNLPDETPSAESSLEEFERRLDALADGLPPVPLLPDDFSRADIYDEYD
jgi:hypothetical protein